MRLFITHALSSQHYRSLHTYLCMWTYESLHILYCIITHSYHHHHHPAPMLATTQQLQGAFTVVCFTVITVHSCVGYVHYVHSSVYSCNSWCDESNDSALLQLLASRSASHTCIRNFNDCWATKYALVKIVPTTPVATALGSNLT